MTILIASLQFTKKLQRLQRSIKYRGIEALNDILNEIKNNKVVFQFSKIYVKNI